MPLSFITACLPFSKQANDSLSGSAATVDSCIFCHVTKEEGFKIVWEVCPTLVLKLLTLNILNLCLRMIILLHSMTVNQRQNTISW